MSVERKQALRSKFLQLLYEATDGDTFQFLNMRQIGSQLDLNDTETGNIVQWLVDRYFVEWAAMGGIINITSHGVDAVENAAPAQRKVEVHPAPQPVVNFNYVHTMIGSQIQQGTGGSAQSMVVQSEEADAVGKMAARIREVEDALGLSDEARHDLDADLETLDSEAGSKEPKTSVFRSALDRIGAVLKSAPGQEAVKQLIKELPELLGQSPHP